MPYVCCYNTLFSCKRTVTLLRSLPEAVKGEVVQQWVQTTVHTGETQQWLHKSLDPHHDGQRHGEEEDGEHEQVHGKNQHDIHLVPDPCRVIQMPVELQRHQDGAHDVDGQHGEH